MNRIFLVEDDQALQEYLNDVLRENDYLIETFSDGVSALAALKKYPPDLLVLDLGLPKVNGESVCIDVRKKYPELPVIILTGRDQTSDIVHGLNLGADDYITKPFEIDELLARIKVRLRNKSDELLQVGDLTLNVKTYEVMRSGRLINLSPHEFKLLQYLMSNKERVVTREMILNRVWMYSYEVDTRVVDVYIGYLRRKIDNGFDKKIINSVRGFGYTIKE